MASASGLWSWADQHLKSGARNGSNINIYILKGKSKLKRAQPAPLKYIYLLLLASFSHSKPNKISFAKSSFISIFSSLSMISIIRILHTQTNYNIMEQNAL